MKSLKVVQTSSSSFRPRIQCGIDSNRHPVFTKGCGLRLLSAWRIRQSDGFQSFLQLSSRTAAVHFIIFRRTLVWLPFLTFSLSPNQYEKNFRLTSCPLFGGTPKKTSSFDIPCSIFDIYPPFVWRIRFFFTRPLDPLNPWILSS
jgi:hypothetical protein